MTGPWWAELAEQVPGLDVIDVHTHIGKNDPDGFTCTPQELRDGLGAIGARGVVFPMQEPDGYPPANDMVIAEAAASGGQLTPFARLDPDDAPLAEAERALDAGAQGIKLHPRGESFELDHPAMVDVFALAGERRLPVLVHAGRGIPALGHHAVALCERHPGLRLILAHACITDLAWIWRSARRPAQPVLRHLVVVGQRPAGAVDAGPAGPDPVRQRRALQHARVRGHHEPALRAAGRAEPGADPAGVRRPDRAAAGSRGPRGRRPADGHGRGGGPAAGPRAHLPGGRGGPGAVRPGAGRAADAGAAGLHGGRRRAPGRGVCRGAGLLDLRDAFLEASHSDGRPKRFAPGLQFLVTAAVVARTPSVPVALSRAASPGA